MKTTLKRYKTMPAVSPQKSQSLQGLAKSSGLYCLLLLGFLAAWMPLKSDAAEGKLIASFYDCWQPEPPPGWRVMTNSRGPIGEVGNYEQLSYVNEKPKLWIHGANHYTDQAKTLRAGTLNNKVSGVRNGISQYAISAYEFSEDYSEDVWVTHGNIQGRNKGEGMDLKIYLNNTLKFEKVAPVSREVSLFQCNLGPVKKGDVVYVAFASKDANALIVQLLYTLEAFAQGTTPPPPNQALYPKMDASSPVYSFQTVRPSEEYLLKHKNLCDELLEQKPNLVFIGDSITARLGTRDMLLSRFGNEYNPGMFAIGGDIIQNVQWRIENGPLEQVKPKAVVLLIGTNNLGKYTPQEICSGIEKIIQTVHKQSPDTQVVLMGIFPRGESIRTDEYAKIKEINGTLAELAKKSDKTVFLDIGDRLVQPDGTISREIMPDLLHVAPKGLDLWAEAISPVLAKIFDIKK